MHLSLSSPAWLEMRAPVAFSSLLSTSIPGLATRNTLISVRQLLPFCLCAKLCLSLLLSLALGVVTIVVCRQPKLTDEYTVFVGWKIVWVGKGHLALKLMLLGVEKGFEVANRVRFKDYMKAFA